MFSLELQLAPECDVTILIMSITSIHTALLGPHTQPDKPSYTMFALKQLFLCFSNKAKWLDRKFNDKYEGISESGGQFVFFFA